MAASTGRSLTVPVWIGLIVVYLVILQGPNLAFGSDDYARFREVDDILGAAVFFLTAAVLVLVLLIRRRHLGFSAEPATT